MLATVLAVTFTDATVGAILFVIARFRKAESHFPNTKKNNTI